MSANSNDLRAMRTLLQQTHTDALDRTNATLPFPFEPIKIAVNDYRKKQAQRTEYDMVLNSLGEAGKKSAAQKISDEDEDSKTPAWRVHHIKMKYWTLADHYYWNVQAPWFNQNVQAPWFNQR